MESALNNNKNNVDISSVCRACLSPDNISCFEETHTDYKHFANIFETLIPVAVKELHTVLSICETCVIRLNDINSFQKMCLETYTTFKQILDGNKDSLETEVLNNSEINDVVIECTDIHQDDNKIENVRRIIPECELECLTEINDNETESKFTNETRFKSNKYLEDDMFHNILIIDDVIDYKCSQCKETFTNIKLLREHIKVHEKEGIIAKYACNRCEKYYTSPLNLTIHMNNHNGVKPFLCRFCKRGFTKKCILMAHLTIHTGIRDFLCSNCGKEFTSMILLNRHKLTHSGDKPFKCDVCPRSFIQARDLKIHTRCHTGEKPYLCSTCGKSFRRSSQLNVHRRTHTGERPYSCSTCGYSFTQSGDLKAHERIHTGEKPYLCTICDKRFRQSSGLSLHMKKHGHQQASEDVT